MDQIHDEVPAEIDLSCDKMFIRVVEFTYSPKSDTSARLEWMTLQTLIQNMRIHFRNDYYLPTLFAAHS